MDPAPHRPLTRERIQRVLDVMDDLGGDPWTLTRAGNVVRYARTPEDHARVGSASLPPDIIEIADDWGRLQVAWSMTGGTSDGDLMAAMGMMAALAAAEDDDDDDDDLEAILAEMSPADREVYLRREAAAAERNQANAFVPISREEAGAVAALAPRIAKALERAPDYLREDAEAAEALETGLQRIGGDDPDARTWLRENTLETPLGVNRFEDTADALAFVEELYAAGAVRVVIASETIEDDDEFDEGGQSADAVKIQLPRDAGQRRALFAIAGREAKSQALKPPKDEGQDLLIVWWD